VTEAMNAKNEMLGEGKIIELISTLKGSSPKEIISAIQKAVVDHAGNAAQYDDITIVVIRT